MWESPIYKFERITDDPKTGNPKREIFAIDVTGSAPGMLVPGQQLENVFKLIAAGLKPENSKILDFGAAKLRNTLYLLKKGFHVYAVEFKKVYDRPQGKEFLEKCEKYKNFHKVTFPDGFYKLNEKFDLILMINVLNVMPIFNERLCALALCWDKLKDNGHLLIYHMRAAASDPHKYSNTNKLNDGWLTARDRQLQNFYVEPSKREIFAMAKATGFSFDPSFKFTGLVGNNHSYVFKSENIILIEESLDLKGVRAGGEKHDPDKPIPEIELSSLLPLYVKELDKVEPGRGKGDAKKFHRLAARILAGVFDTQLGEPKIEVEVDEGLGRIDLVFENKMENGFFKRLQSQINCPLISVECKNYQKDIENPEFDQLSGRLKPQRGMFGMLVCRGVKDKSKIIQQCKTKLDKGEHIIVLCDDDLRNLVEAKLGEGDEAVDEYMSNKHNEILL